jgi:hypothetical protein
MMGCGGGGCIARPSAFSAMLCGETECCRNDSLMPAQLSESKSQLLSGVSGSNWASIRLSNRASASQSSPVCVAQQLFFPNLFKFLIDITVSPENSHGWGKGGRAGNSGREWELLNLWSSV